MIVDSSLCSVLLEPDWEECGTVAEWRMGEEGSEEEIRVCNSHRNYFIQYGAILTLIDEEAVL